MSQLFVELDATFRLLQTYDICTLDRLGFSRLSSDSEDVCRLFFLLLCFFLCLDFFSLGGFCSLAAILSSYDIKFGYATCTANNTSAALLLSDALSQNFSKHARRCTRGGGNLTYR